MNGRRPLMAAVLLSSSILTFAGCECLGGRCGLRGQKEPPVMADSGPVEGKIEGTQAVEKPQRAAWSSDAAEVEKGLMNREVKPTW